jgi:hypothetical protein
MKYSICTAEMAKVFIPVGCVALSALAVAPAQAAALVLTENPNDTWSIYANDFDRGTGLRVNGSQVQVGYQTPASTTLPATNNQVSFSGNWLDLGQTQASSRTIYFVAANNASQVTDLFSYNLSSSGNVGTISGFFQSLSTPFALPGAVAQGDIYQAGTTAEFSAPFLGGTITTAANAAAVPEPFTMIGTFIGGAAAFRMKKKLKNLAK